MLRIYGSRISYYTGKVEAYFRYRGIAYELLPTYAHAAKVKQGANTTQMPAVELDDGRWLSDSTPILAWFESEQSAPSIYPSDPALRFVALLLEDYADEWLWRPAMHYRWSYRLDRDHASGLLADEQTGHGKVPRMLRRREVVKRQLGGFVRGDGVDDATRAHVEKAYANALHGLEAIFAERPFVLGDTPTIADFGLMGPMLRHFGQDPTPADLMRERAPGVYEWVARVWNTRATGNAPGLIDALDNPLAGLLAEACSAHLGALGENAAAYARRATRSDMTIQGQAYTNLPVSRYRVWCLEELRREWRALDEDAQASLRPHLPEPGAAVLWDEGPPRASEYDLERKAPFNRAINVYGEGGPPP